MKKYLVIVDFNSGFTDISNVGIISANSDEEVRDIFRSKTLKHYNNSELYVKCIDDVYMSWFYYI